MTAEARRDQGDPPDRGALGAEIRALRRSHGLTLEQLAERSQLSIGFLSLVERGLKRLSHASLQRISAALGVEIGWFLPPEPAGDSRERGIVVRKGAHRRIDYSRLSGTDYLGEVDLLLSPSIEGALSLTMMQFAPGGTSGDDPLVHEGEEAGYVLTGELTLEIEGETYVLEAGDSFGFQGSRPHRYLNRGRENLEVVLANTPVVMAKR